VTVTLGDSSLHQRQETPICITRRFQHYASACYMGCLLLCSTCSVRHATAMVNTWSVILLVAYSYGRHRVRQRMSLTAGLLLVLRKHLYVSALCATCIEHWLCSLGMDHP
jgi:hypothetical protein